MAENTTTIDPVASQAENQEPEKEKKSSGSGSGKFKTIRVGQGNDYGLVVNGQKIEVYSIAPRRLSFKKRQVTIEGHSLNIYSGVLLTPASSPSTEIIPDYLHLAAIESGKIVFEFPEKSVGLLKDNDSIWVKLQSENYPQANAIVSQYLVFGDIEEESEEPTSKDGKKSSGEDASGEGPSVAGQFMDSIMDAAGETIGGVVSPFLPGSLQKSAARENLKKTLQSGSKENKKKAIEEAKRLGDTEGLKQALKNASREDRELINKALREMGGEVMVEMTPTKEVTQSSGKNLGLEEDLSDDAEAAGQTEALSRPPTENFSVAGKILNEYLQNNPEIIGNVENSEVVMEALGSGKIETLNSDQLTSLETVLTTVNSSGQAQASAELSGAINSISQEVETFRAKLSVAGQIKTEASVSGSVGATAEAKVSTEAKASGRVETSVRSEGGGGSQVNININNQGQTLGAQLPSFSVGQKQSAKAMADKISNTVSQNIEGSISQNIKQEPEYQNKRAEVEAGMRQQANQGGTPQPTETEIHKQTLAELSKESPEVVEKHKANPESISSQPQDDPAVQSMEVEINSQIEEALGQVGLPDDQKQELKRFLSQAVPKLVWQNFAKNYPQKAEKYKQEIPQLNEAMGEMEKPIQAEEEQIQIAKISPELEAQLQAMRKQTINPKAVSGEKSVFKPGVTLPKGVAGSEPKGGMGGKVGQGSPGLDSSEAGAGESSVDLEPEKVGLGTEARTQEPKEKQPTLGAELEGVEAPKKAEDDESVSKESEQPSGNEQQEKPPGPEKPGERPPEKKKEPAKGGGPGEKGLVPGEQMSAPGQTQTPTDMTKDVGIDQAINSVVKEVNLALNAPLAELIVASWAAIVASIALLSIPLALIWDLALLLKTSIIRRVLRPFLKTDALKKRGDEIAKKIKFSVPVKLNIALINLVAIVTIGVLALFFVVIFKTLCDNPFTYGAIWLSGNAEVCESLDFVEGNSFNDYLNSPNNSNLTLIGTAQWNTEINNVSNLNGIDACILKVVVQKESAGKPNVIGCDCAKNGQPQECLEPDRTDYFPGYKFNWDKCSYGIGLTQWTIYPKGGSGYRRWENINIPSRDVLGNNFFYKVEDFINPSVSLNLTAKVMAAAYNKSSKPDPRGKTEDAFIAYVGQSSFTSQLVSQRMLLYDLCKNSSQ